MGKSSGQGKSLKLDISLEVLVMTDRYTLTLLSSALSCEKQAGISVDAQGMTFLLRVSTGM